MNLHTLHRQPISLSEELGRGGEARILKVTDQPNLVAKIYHQPTDMHEAKLKAMLARPPRQSQEQLTVVWPLDLLYQQGQFVGFLMPNLHSMGDCDAIFKFYNPPQRATHYPSFTWRYLHRTALNVMIAAKGIHAAGHVIGDINESNILVTPQALIRWVDTDSFQVISANGQVYRCPVGKPEYTPPELQGIDFKQVNQTVAHDYFGLGVILFQLLMEGYHPFTGTLISRESVGRVDLYCIRKGLFPYSPNAQVAPPLNAPKLESLHPALQMAFKQCFVEGHHDPAQRPTPRQWIAALEEAEAHLIMCTKNPRHIYADHVGFCSWCEAEPLPQKLLTGVIEKSLFQPSQKMLEDVVLQPTTIKIEPSMTGLHFVYQYNRSEAISMLIGALLFAVPLIFIEPWLVSYSWLLLICFVLIINLLNGLYRSMVFLFNRTHITIISDSLNIKSGPLPQGGNFQINIADIHQIYAQSNRPDTGFYLDGYCLNLVTQDETRVLFWASDFQSVRFLEQELRQYLHLPEMPLQQDYLTANEANPEK